KEAEPAPGQGADLAQVEPHVRPFPLPRHPARITPRRVAAEGAAGDHGQRTVGGAPGEREAPRLPPGRDVEREGDTARRRLPRPAKANAVAGGFDRRVLECVPNPGAAEFPWAEHELEAIPSHALGSFDGTGDGEILTANADEKRIAQERRV